MSIFYPVRNITFLLTLVTIQFTSLEGQDVSLTLQKTESLSSLYKNLVVYDINGDTCSLAIVKRQRNNRPVHPLVRRNIHQKDTNNVL